MSAYNFLWNDKHRILNGAETMHQSTRTLPTPYPINYIDFNYFVDLSCTTVTVSHSFIMDI